MPGLAAVQQPVLGAVAAFHQLEARVHERLRADGRVHEVGEAVSHFNILLQLLVPVRAVVPAVGEVSRGDAAAAT